MSENLRYLVEIFDFDTSTIERLALLENQLLAERIISDKEDFCNLIFALPKYYSLDVWMVSSREMFSTGIGILLGMQSDKELLKNIAKLEGVN